MTEDEYNEKLERMIEKWELEIHKISKSRDNFQAYSILISIVAFILFLMLVASRGG